MDLPFNHRGSMPTLQNFAAWANEKGLKADIKTLEGVALLELCVDIYSLGFEDAVRGFSDGLKAKGIVHADSV